MQQDDHIAIAGILSIYTIKGKLALFLAPVRAEMNKSLSDRYTYTLLCW